jgi:uncharacterized delta-60 repeat protein
MLSSLPLNISRRRKPTSVLASLTFLFLLFNLSAAAAAPGDLDPTFGNGGVTVSPGTDYFAARSVAVQPDGKIVAGGVSAPGGFNINGRFTLIRYLPNGSFDTSFGTNGRVITTFPEYQANTMVVNDIAILPNGKIVAVGSGAQPSPFGIGSRTSLFVVVYNSDGSINTTFENDGKFVSPAGGLRTSGEAIAVQPDGKFLVAGYGGGAVKGTVPYKLLLYRFSAAGLDSTFFNGGTAVIQIPGMQVRSHSIAIQPDGKIITGGAVLNNNNDSQVIGLNLYRYLANGTPDASFGNNGLVAITDGIFNEATAVLAQSDGKIVAVSSVGLGNNKDFALLRFNSDGSPDTLFGTNGKVITVVSNLSDVARAGVLEPNGKIIVAGFSSNSSAASVPQPALVRYDTKGTLDPTFGVGGIASVPAGLALHDVRLQPDGKILAGAGFFTVVRYLNNGMRDYDFDGDRKADVAIFRPAAAAEWYWLKSSNGESSGLQFGNGTDKPVATDYDGDGKTDVAVFRDGDWYRVNSSNNSFVAVHFGQAGDKPVPADFDGDDKADLAVYRQGDWYILNSADDSFRADHFGIVTDKPVIGDFDGDGKSDLAVYRDGVWYVQQSRDGFFGAQFGTNTDKPVAADYDGDGKTDLAVYRPSDGTWYLQRSHLGFTASRFGVATDKPVPADYDGDGKTDIAVYRDGNWYLQQSTAGFNTVQFGASTDAPVPNAFFY